MCGIFGLVNTKKHDLASNLQKMLDSMHHRGPDKKNLHFFKKCILGHSRLTIVDPIGGSQPMVNNQESVGLTFNGEIYGYRNIKSKIDYNFHTKSDTELLLALYEKFGFEMLNKLPGMFSFGLWDEKKHLLFCARDRFGEKPFYYATSEKGEFIFSSEIKSILSSGLINPKIDLESMSHYLKRLYVSPSRTIYKNIFSLPPGHFLKYQNNNIIVDSYWELPKVVQNIDEKFAVEKFKYLLKKAIKNQMIADVPVGAFLSGGLDSSTIVALASKHTDKLKTFTFGFSDSKYNEVDYARSIAKKYKTNHYELFDDKKNLPNTLIDMQKIYDEPFADSSNIPTYLISKFASEDVKVVLSGDGADELLGGYDFWYDDLLRFQEYSNKLHPSLSSKIKNWFKSDISNKRGEDLHQKYDSINKLFHLQRQFFSEQDLIDFGLENENSVLNNKKVLNIEDCLANDLLDYLPGDILVKTDRASMANSLEVRSPFLDIDLAEFCISLPHRYKIDTFKQKKIMRKAFSHYWPRNVNKRKKMGFGAPVNDWLQQDAIVALKNEYLGNKNHKIFSYLDSKKIYTYKNDSNYKTWILLNLSLWLEHHFEG